MIDYSSQFVLMRAEAKQLVKIKLLIPKPTQIPIKPNSNPNAKNNIKGIPIKYAVNNV